jgi:hypothetical protein
VNDLTLDTNTGGNEVSDNNSETIDVEAGNVEVVSDIVNKLNTSVVDESCCEEDTILTISGNGSDSQNNINIEEKNNTDIHVTNEAEIKNDNSGFANTGGNEVTSNSGDVSLITGDIDVKSSIKNTSINQTSVQGGSGAGDINLSISNNLSCSINKISTAFVNNANIEIESRAYVANNNYWTADTEQNILASNLGNLSLKTGDINLDLFIKNGPINIGGIDWGCCGFYDPGEPSGEDNKGGTSTGNDSSNEGNNSSSSESSGGEILSEAASTQSDVGVYGLSNTSADPQTTIYFWIGTLLIVLGVRFIVKDLETYTSMNKSDLQ